MTRPAKYPHRFASYEIRIDGQVAGEVAAGGRSMLIVVPGEHAISVNADWCSSLPVEFSVCAGEQITFECGAKYEGWKHLLVLFYFVFMLKSCLWIRRSG